MALNSSGPISLIGATAGQSIQQELGLSGQISLLDSAVRTLAGVPTGSVTMPTNFYGKSTAFVFNQTISSNTNDYNLRNAAIAGGWDQVLALNATITINAGVFVGSSSTGSAAFQTGSSFPAGSTLSIINNGHIVGRGGNGGGNSGSAGNGGGGGAGVVNGSGGSSSSVGGQGPGSNGTNTTGGAGRSISVILAVGGQGILVTPGNAGFNGGLALLVNYPTSITNNNTIGGGGGGGGQGAFSLAGPPNGRTATFAAGGAGGDLGSAGSVGGTTFGGAGGAFGSAGAAISGNSNITWLAFGTRLGAIS